MTLNEAFIGILFSGWMPLCIRDSGLKNVVKTHFSLYKQVTIFFPPNFIETKACQCVYMGGPKGAGPIFKGGLGA